jgi:hypothetical protein
MNSMSNRSRRFSSKDRLRMSSLKKKDSNIPKFKFLDSLSSGSLQYSVVSSFILQFISSDIYLLADAFQVYTLYLKIYN